MSTGRVLDVRLDEVTVGQIERRNGRLRFTYDADWQAWDAATPLSLSMPLAAREHRHHVVNAFLWGLLPDNDRVLERWAREFGVSPSHPLGLLANVGEDLPGAMRLVDPDAPVRIPAGDGIDWLSEGDVADLLAEVRADQTAWLGRDTAARWSLAGAQPKIALLYDDERGWGRPRGRPATNRILKPAIADFDDHDLNEHLCLKAAGLLDLRAVRSEVVSFGAERAIVVERYDRIQGSGGGWERVHQEDLCQALAVHPAQKYQNEGGPSPVGVVKLLRASIPDRHTAERDVAGFIDALIFNWLIAAPDAHAKNYSVLLSGSRVRLAPLYDIASALPNTDLYVPKVRSAMKIGPHYLLSAIKQSSWRTLATDVGVDADALIVRARELAAAAPAAFSDATAVLTVTRLTSDLPARLIDGVAERSARCLTGLG